MKKKQVLLLSVMLVLTTLTVIAQDSRNVHPAPKKIIPFGEKLPPPQLKNLSGKRQPGNPENGISRWRMPGTKSFNANVIKNDPDGFKQLLQERRSSLMQTNRQFPLPALNGRPANQQAGLEKTNDQKADFHIVKDVNSLAESFPSNNDDFDPYPSYAILNGVIYFAADDGIHGNELWRSDGTSEGTYMVKDISPGSEPTIYIRNITAANGKLFFAAHTTKQGYEPWVSDGTEKGTYILMDIAPGSDWGYPSGFVSLGNLVYFVSDIDGSIWSALWKTDGTPSGTMLLKNFAKDGNGGEFLSQLTVVNDLLFFTFYSFNSFAYELWRTDGSDKGTYNVTTHSSFIYGVPAQLTSYNSQLYFSAEDSTGRKLWVSDGTDAGTKPAPNNNDVLIYAEETGVPFPVLNNVLYVPGISEIGYIGGLYKYNASNKKGLEKVKQFTGVDPVFIVPAEMATVNNKLYFRVLNLNGGIHDELWSTESNSNSAKLVQKFAPGVAIYNLYNGNNKLYFGRTNKAIGTELWTGINTARGTVLHPVSNIFKGDASSIPFFLTAFKSKLFFSATDDKKGTELFVTEGHPFSTSLVKDINVTSTSSSNAAYFSNWITPFGNDVLFNAYENKHGFELYRTNGTAAGTRFLNDVLPGEAGSYPEKLLAKKGKGYFIAQTTDTTLSVYKTDGTASGLQKMTPAYNFRSKEVVSFDVADNGLVFYVLFNYYTFRYELWRTDGTSQGTFSLTKNLYVYDALHILNNTALFVAGDRDHGYELWSSDGTIKGTHLVKDINPGKDDAAPGGLYIYNNEVYFGAYDGVARSFWKSDGTKEGTVKLKNIDPLYGNTPAETENFFGVSNNMLFFSAIKSANGKGIQLWKTDGTSAGTQVIKDLNPADSMLAGAPFYLTDVNGTLFFVADDGVHGQELWKTDGTTKGTQLVKDNAPGAESSYLDDLVSYGGMLYFTNNYSVWSSDGTSDGTLPVNDGVISDAVVNNIISKGDQLFLSGYTSKYGWELFAGKIDNAGMITASRLEDKVLSKTATSFDATIYPNPVAAQGKMQITGNVKNITVSITDINGKKLWQSSNISSSLISLPTEGLAAGTYFVTVTNGAESKTIKLVKQ